jgi:hypothetical protein
MSTSVRWLKLVALDARDRRWWTRVRHALSAAMRAFREAWTMP